jgi:2-dehydro-3-deoxyphosphogluconate aldolase/(4S)-4-hydroxy-2-oxoglutarate aldolase
VGVVELTATTPDWSDALRTTRADHPHLLVGVGTVTDAGAAERALAGGAHFLVSPYPRPEVRRVAEAGAVLFLEGGFTPAEVADAASRGPAKVFPAHVGGPAYLRSLVAILPGARLIPTGGVTLADLAAYLAAGAFAVGVGSDLTAGPDIAGRVAAALDAPVAS